MCFWKLIHGHSAHNWPLLTTDSKTQRNSLRNVACFGRIANLRYDDCSGLALILICHCINCAIESRTKIRIFPKLRDWWKVYFPPTGCYDIWFWKFDDFAEKFLIQNAPNPKIEMFFISACSCLCVIYWSHIVSWEWRCSWSSADRRCSNYIWVINNSIAY